MKKTLTIFLLLIITINGFSNFLNAQTYRRRNPYYSKNVSRNKKSHTKSYNQHQKPALGPTNKTSDDYLVMCPEEAPKQNIKKQYSQRDLILMNIKKILKLIQQLVYIAAGVSITLLGLKGIFTTKGIDWTKIGWIGLAVLIVTFSSLIVDFFTPGNSKFAELTAEDETYIDTRNPNLLLKKCSPRTPGARIIHKRYIKEANDEGFKL